MEKTKEKSEEQAAFIAMINPWVAMLDIEYLREMVTDMFNQASRQETLLILNPSYPTAKNDVIREQAEALKSLCDYVDHLRKVEELKKQVSLQESQQAAISRLFL